MLIPISPEMHFAYLQQERLREAVADRLAHLARQHAKSQQVGVGVSERKEFDR